MARSANKRELIRLIQTELKPQDTGKARTTMNPSRPRGVKSTIFATAAACFLVSFGGIAFSSWRDRPLVRSPSVNSTAAPPGPAPPGSLASAPPLNNSIEAWRSPHQVDCREMAASQIEGGMYREINLTEPSFQMNIYDPAFDGVSKIIHEKGCWECRHLRDMLSALSQHPGAYFLDVGGNIGMWSLVAAAAGRQTFTIEALPDNCKRFCRSVDRNNFYGRTHLMNVAATSTPEKFRLNVPKGNIGGTRVVAAGDDADGDDATIVRGVPIDSLDLPTDLPVVLKVDVEGHELQALLGATRFLESANVVYAAMELRPGLQKDGRWREIFGILSSKGLKPYRINYEDETELDAERLWEWKHFKHPIVRYYDVVWRRDDFDRGTRLVHPLQ